MEIEIPTRSIEDRQKLINWLSIAAASDPEVFAECTHIIKRFQREIIYYKQRKKFEDEDRLEHEKDVLPKETQKEIDSWWEKTKEKDNIDWQKTIQTRDEIIKFEDKNFQAALNYMKDHTINDESLAYGKDENYGGIEIKSSLEQILDMLIKYIHLGAKNIPTHEFYNDYIDNWYFKCNGNFDSVKSKELMHEKYYFPSEVFIIKIKDFYFYYSETNGQGTSFDAYLFKDEKQLEEFGKQYGYSLEEVKKKAYIFDDNNSKVPYLR